MVFFFYEQKKTIICHNNPLFLCKWRHQRQKKDVAHPNFSDFEANFYNKDKNLIGDVYRSLHLHCTKLVFDLHPYTF